MNYSQLTYRLQTHYQRELATCPPGELPYFVGYLDQLAVSPDLTQLEGRFSLWTEVDGIPHLMAVTLADGTYEVRGIPRDYWTGVNPTAA